MITLSGISSIINILVYIIAGMAFLLLVNGYKLHNKSIAAKKKANEKRRREKPTPKMVALSHNERHAGNDWYSQVYDQRQEK